MQGLSRKVAKTPFLGRGLMILYRLVSGLRYAKRPAKNFAWWLLTSREHTNYTYDLTAANKRYLAAFVSHVTGIEPSQARAFLTEIEDDLELREHLRKGIRNSDEAAFADPEMHFGRRLGWYALVRAVKPRVVVETGVDKGLGACVLSAALARNAREGHPGHYYGTDINPRAGYLLSGEYARHGEILYGDSIESLEALDVEIDLFINDSDHSAEYEAREYAAVESKLSQGALLVGDNAHATQELLDFAEKSGREFLYFQEQPAGHWYPGGGIGVAYRKDLERCPEAARHGS